ncbi:MAG: hypothetical protein ABIW47_05390 [Ginsengibacter sp.]
MNLRGKFFLFLMYCILGMYSSPVFAQEDSAKIKDKKSLVSKMIDSFKKDSTEVDVANELERNDKAYNKYKGLIIRNIEIKRLDFGTRSDDTTKKLQNTLIDIANKVHYLTKDKVIKRNLFFKENEKIQPFLFADNARFLRQLPYLQDAEISIKKLSPGSDSADVLVIVKDVFSLGGAVGSLGLKNTQIEVREDNFAGSGNALIFYGLYDAKRTNNFGLGGEYNRRNIGGSFIDGRIGYISFNNSKPGPKNENNYYFNLSKPLVNRYMNWTYELDASYNATRNLYVSDSLYKSDFHFRNSNIEVWAGYNLRAKEFTTEEEKHHLRKIIGMRFIHNQFQEKPGIYTNEDNWRYADLLGLLGTITFYRQNFYKTQYIYGFGRNEDIPEGLLLSVTSGYTIKENRSRPFIGFNYERYRFNKKNNYLSYTLRAEGYLNKKSIEDINLLAAISYFDKLKPMGNRWKQRFFLNLDVAQQVNTEVNEPLFVNSKFGLPEFGSGDIGGSMRATAKAESVFFSPWSLVSFRFAPFIFTNVSVFTPYTQAAKIYPSVGGGIRTRNESFVFGTIELKGFYFPRKNYYNEHFNIEISTNVIFKYNKQFVKKPSFIEIN